MHATSPTSAPARIVCVWTCRRSLRTYELARRGRLWLVSWATADDWSIGGGRSIPAAFAACGVRRIPHGFPYQGSGCARRRAVRMAPHA